MLHPTAEVPQPLASGDTDAQYDGNGILLQQGQYDTCAEQEPSWHLKSPAGQVTSGAFAAEIVKECPVRASTIES